MKITAVFFLLEEAEIVASLCLFRDFMEGETEIQPPAGDPHHFGPCPRIRVHIDSLVTVR